VADLRALSPSPILLLFDALDQAEKSLQDWLLNNLVAHLVPLPHLRLVLAGRTVPEPPGSCIPHTLHHQLSPVTDEAAYIAYCQSVQASLVEQSIRDFARATGYKPGFFADLIINYLGGEGRRG